MEPVRIDDSAHSIESAGLPDHQGRLCLGQDLVELVGRSWAALVCFVLASETILTVTPGKRLANASCNRAG